MTALDIELMRRWIGSTERCSDIVTPRLVASLCATLDIPEGELYRSAPACIHWCLAPQVVRMSDLGSDGHAARGGFLPPVPLPRRMWAGGEVVFHDAIRLGDQVERVSRVADVAVKQGRTGTLCFVTVQHEFSHARGLALTERQDIVYRELPMQDAPSMPAAAPALQPGSWQREIRCNSTLLFRYSALSFNSHRIHYDLDFSREHEGYSGLVVHGPLQASCLLELASSIGAGRTPRRFAFRAIEPLFSDTVLTVHAVEDEGGLQLWAVDGAGRRTMQAQASW